MIREFNLNILVGLILAIVPLLSYVLDEPYYITLSTKVAILALAGVGLNLALGYGGLISFGHALFFGVGGYVSAILASHALNYEPLVQWPIELNGTTQMLIIWPISILICSLLALLVGALSLRTSGVYFIMITLAFAQMTYYFAISWPTYGGEDGLSVYLRSTFPYLNTMDALSFFAICYFLLLGGIFLSSRIVNARFGLALQASRQNALRVSSIGIKPFNIRLITFTISGAITGLAGALYTDLNRFVSPSVMSWNTSGELMVIVIIGGVARLYGPVVGAAIFILLEQILGGITEHWQFWLGLLLLIIVLFAKGGLISLLTVEERHV